MTRSLKDNRSQNRLAKAKVYYNGSCPVCAFEVGRYRRAAVATGAPLEWIDVSLQENARVLAPYGLSCDDAYRRMTAVVDGAGEPLLGLDAFIAIWARLPGLIWAAKLFTWPVIRPVSAFFYEHVAARLIYLWNKRRLRQAGTQQTR